MLLVHISADGLRKTRSRDSGHGQHVYGQRHGNRLRRRDGDQDYPYGRQRRKRFGRSYDFGKRRHHQRRGNLHTLGNSQRRNGYSRRGRRRQAPHSIGRCKHNQPNLGGAVCQKRRQGLRHYGDRLAQQSRICRRICGHR